MTSPSLELQGAIVARLKDFGAVTAIVGQNVFDRVPRRNNGEISAPYPLVGFEGSDDRPTYADCITAFDISMDLHCYSQAVGQPEVKRLAEAVRVALHDYELPLDDNALVSFEHTGTLYLTETDGLTSHAVLTFEALVDQP